MKERLAKEHARIAKYEGEDNTVKLPSALDRIISRHLADLARLAEEPSGEPAINMATDAAAHPSHYQKCLCPECALYEVLRHTCSGVWCCTACTAGGASYFIAAAEARRAWEGRCDG